MIEIKTPNSRGYSSPSDDFVSLKFIELTSSFKQPILDIGCGAGLYSEKLLTAGHTVIANDLSQESLDQFYSRVQIKSLEKLTVLPGNFLENKSIEDESLAGVYCSRVLQFLDPDEFKKGLSKILKWLIPKGIFGVIIFTPFRPILDPIQNELRLKRDTGVDWPYEITNYRDFLSDEVKPSLPDYVNLFDKNLLECSLVNSGFEILEIDWIPYKSLSGQVVPRGLVGALAAKQ